jgi:flagellar hook protein FlgE
MGFQHGLSGLNAAAKNLDVIGNNVANANTVGAKSTRAEFADIYASSLSSAGGSFNGIGVQVAAMSQQFSQGEITTTSNPMDLAINGRGFFQLSTGGTLSFTRNGQFKFDREGYIVNNQGARLMGYPGNGTATVPIGVPTELQVDIRDIAPKSTQSSSASLNLDARSAIVPAAPPFSASNPDTYAGATSISVYDSQGVEHNLSLYFQKTAANQWSVYGSADGTQIGAAPLSTLTFQANGTLNTAASPQPFTVNIPIGGGLPALAVQMDLTKVSQYGAAFSVSELSQDGYSTGRLSSLNISPDGLVEARYTNGQTQAQGRVVLANFSNPQGLLPLGGNAWQPTRESGQPLPAPPGSGTLGLIRSGALEQSNVDLTGELVNMITAQRAYQANAQTIRAQDQVLQTIVNLR